MKNILTISLLLLACSSFKSQQIGITSQYLLNDFSINPGVAGTKSYSPLSVSFRRQWTGIDEAPVTQNLMYHTSLGESAGFGGHVFNDASGPSRRTGFNTTFAYNIKTSKETNLSFGLSGSLTQFSINRDRLITEIPNDIAIVNLNNSLIVDCNFGIYWSGVRHFAGFSSFNLFENKTDITALTTPITNTLNRVFYTYGGYNFKIGAIIELQPSMIMRIMNDIVQFDGNLKLTVKNTYSLAISYRNKDAVAFIGGINIGTTTVGYSYDLGVSKMKTYSSGSHEIFLCYKFKKDNKSKTPWKNRNRVYSSNSLEN